MTKAILTARRTRIGRRKRQREIASLRAEAKEKAQDVIIPETLLAYAAGVIDSDGCIGIYRRPGIRRVNGERPILFYERVQVAQVTPEAVTLLKALFGGNLKKNKPHLDTWQPMYQWRVTNTKAVICIRAILPYLRIKHVQAENCLALHEIKKQARLACVRYEPGRFGAMPRPDNMTAAMEFCYAAAKRLNARGAERNTPKLEAVE